MTVHVARSTRGRVRALGLAALVVSGLGLGTGIYRLRHWFGCPMTRATAAEIARMRASVLPTLQEGDLAPTRPAFGFSIGSTRRQDVDTWARSNGVTCEPSLGGSLLRCRGAGRVAPDRVTPTDEIAFAFGANGTLDNASVLTSKMAPARAGRVFTDARAWLDLRLGPATRSVGPSNLEPLEERGATSVVEYRFADYLAEITSTNAGAGGVVVREHVMSLRD